MNFDFVFSNMLYLKLPFFLDRDDWPKIICPKKRGGELLLIAAIVSRFFKFAEAARDGVTRAF
jgi:hypothetical protein